MAEKIEELLSSFNEFKAVQIAAQQAQEKNQQDLAAKFDQGGRRWTGEDCSDDGEEA